MKKSLLVLFAIVLATSAMGQKTVRVLKSNLDHLTLEYTSGDISTNMTVYDDQKFITIEMNGYASTSIVGTPQLPVLISVVEIPICKNVAYTVLNAEYDTINLKCTEFVMPSQPSRCKSDDSKYELKINKSIYDKDEYYAHPLIKIEKIGIARDKNLATIAFAPMQYNPQTGMAIVCTNAEIQFDYHEVDEKATINLKRYYTPSFSIGHDILNQLDVSSNKAHRTSSPVSMVIVSNPMFRGELDEYVQWKRRKGMLVNLVYTDQSEVGTSSVSIINYLKGLYTQATENDPAPTYVLLVGDVEQLPACADKYPADAFWYEEHHPTDLYYAEWTGDMLPDAYYGRFSASNVAELVPQIEKTLMYEQYTFPDPSFLDKAVLVAGADDRFGRTHADPTVSQVSKYYINGNNGYTQVKCFQNNISTNPGAPNVSVYTNSSDATVRAAYSEGAGWINYTAHGNIKEWTIPYFNNSQVSQMTNNNKFGIMIGNCCLSNKFNEDECFGEALVRQNNYRGAVNYIGGSNYTYWDEDVYWSMGVRSSIYATMPLEYDANHLGMYDKLFHLNGENRDLWVTCVGGIVYAGNMSVQSSSSSLANYYWEVYHVLGDPSVAPWLTQAEEMHIIPLSFVTTESDSAKFIVAPYAYVAITKDSVLITATYANEHGIATLHFDNLECGDYEVAASLMGYRTQFHPLTIGNVGIENVSNFNLNVYPNPVNSMLTIESDDMQEVSIINIMGSEVMHKKVVSSSVQFDVQSIPNGVYFVKVRTLNGVAVRKIVKR